MSESLTLRRKCSRCPRTEYLDISIEDAVKLSQGQKVRKPALQVVLDGTMTVEFDGLCTHCRVAVESHLLQIGRALDHQSPKSAGKPRKRKAKEKAGNPE